MEEFTLDEFGLEDFLIAADFLESNSDGFTRPAKCLRDAALFKAKTGSSFVTEGDLPSLLVEAARIYADQITLSRFTQVVFSVRRDHKTRSFSFVLQAGTYWLEGKIGERDIWDVERSARSEVGIVGRFVQLIVRLKLQERLLRVE